MPRPGTGAPTASVSVCAGYANSGARPGPLSIASRESNNHLPLTDFYLRPANAAGFRVPPRDRQARSLRAKPRTGSRLMRAAPSSKLAQAPRGPALPGFQTRTGCQCRERSDRQWRDTAAHRRPAYKRTLMRNRTPVRTRKMTPGKRTRIWTLRSAKWRDTGHECGRFCERMGVAFRTEHSTGH